MKTPILFLLVLIIGSCAENEQLKSLKQPNPLTVSTSENFQEIIALNLQLTNAFATYLDGLDDEKRSTEINKLISGDIKLVDLFSQLGYSSRSEFIDIQNKRVSIYQSLSDEFDGFKEFDRNQLIELFILSEKTLRVAKMSKSAKVGPDYCSTTLLNCVGGANAVLLLETTACVASVFIPFIGVVAGPVCEAAALAHHYYSTNQCNADYNNCNGIPQS